MPEIDLPTVIFALVALFVAFKLRSVLGMRQDSERQTGGLLAPLRRAPAPPAQPVVQPDAAASAIAPTSAADRWKGVAEPDPAVWSGLDAIAAADRSFSPQAFLSGARVAYDMVVHAFAAGDSATLRNLMTPEAIANFDNAIRSRVAAGQTMTTTVV
jgi:predicted lipid-binding transport protein (Tim44 family)